MTYCKVCLKQHSRYLMNNKPVCLECDELLFDVEIETEEFEALTGQAANTPAKETEQKQSPKPSLKRAKATIK